MIRSEKYYENTKNALPHKNVIKFIEMNDKKEKAIDLGCGAGRDTIYLIRNGWNVLAIDREDVEDLILEKLNEKEMKRFRFLCQNFESIELEKCDLIVSNFAIPFCSKKYFDKFWNNISDSISSGGYFVGNFFGLRDSWATINKNMTFLSKKQVTDLFEEFEIIEFDEYEKDSKTALGEFKHWHIYEIIARKK